jgi:hypothetical protein
MQQMVVNHPYCYGQKINAVTQVSQQKYTLQIVKKYLEMIPFISV